MFFLLVIFLTLPHLARADWEATLKSHFDIVDTFANDQDFTGTLSNPGDVYTGSMPVKTGGAASIWNYYSVWGTLPVSNWIANHGSDSIGYNQLSNGVPSSTGKSMVIDLFNTKGPSRMGAYFGTPGNGSSGYSDIYVFFRIKAPPNLWPTSCAGGDCTAAPPADTGTYTAGQPYAYLGSWKFFNMATGWIDSRHWDNPTLQCSQPNPVDELNPSGGSAGNCRYGDTEDLIHLKDLHGFIVPDQELWFSSYINWSTLAQNFPTNQWAAVEMHYKKETTAGNSGDGVFQMWIYDGNGNALNAGNPVIDLNSGDSTSVSTTINYTLPGVNHNFNRIVIGGNNSNEYIPGSGMTSGYYVGDLIVNKSRIGLNYYSLIGGSSDAIAPAAPSGLNVQ